MIKASKLYLSFAFFLIVGVAWQVQAHQQKEAISTILFNSRSGNIEISHRFYIHDAEHAVKRILDKQADLMTDEAAQKAFADYVVAHFTVSFNQEGALPLKLLGQEIAGKFFWVYQEAAIVSQPSQIEVSYNALMEIWPSQRNIVNVEGVGELKSLELLSSQYQKILTF